MNGIEMKSFFVSFRQCIGYALVACFGFQAFSAALADSSIDASQCGQLTNAYGPFDYRTAPQSNKNLVENPHYRDQAVAVSLGKTRARSNEVMDDLDYTLRVFPNHPGALMTIDRLGIILKSEKPYKAKWKLECYYQRGLRMAPDDGMVYLLYALYLQKRSRIAESREKLEMAVKYISERDAWSPNIEYNVGLAYFELGEYSLAKKFAERAANGGFSLPGLKAKLQRGGHWQQEKVEIPVSEGPAVDNRSTDDGDKKPDMPDKQ